MKTQKRVRFQGENNLVIVAHWAVRLGEKKQIPYQNSNNWFSGIPSFWFDSIFTLNFSGLWIPGNWRIHTVTAMVVRQYTNFPFWDFYIFFSLNFIFLVCSRYVQVSIFYQILFEYFPLLQSTCANRKQRAHTSSMKNTGKKCLNFFLSFQSFVVFGPLFFLVDILITHDFCVEVAFVRYVLSRLWSEM